MDILIKLSPDDITEALTEYLTKRGFKYVDHEFLDGIAEVRAEAAPAPMQAAKAAAAGTPTRKRGEVPVRDLTAEAASTDGESAVEEEPSLTLAELMSGPSSLFDDDDAAPTPRATRAESAADVSEITRLLAENEKLMRRRPSKGQA